MVTLFSFSVYQDRYHTWYLLRRCISTYRFEIQSRKCFLTLLGSQIGLTKKGSTIQTDDDLTHQQELSVGLASLVTGDGAIFCTTVPNDRVVLIDIFTDNIEFNKDQVGEFCQEYFGAGSYEVNQVEPS